MPRYIDADRLIQLMKERDADCGNPKNTVDEGYSLAVKHMIKEIEANNEYHCEIYETNKTIEELKKEEWIPCSVRMPDDDDYVLVTLKSDEGEIFTDGSTAYYDGKLWRWSDECMVIQSDVVAWQPLPEPYKGDTDATK